MSCWNLGGVVSSPGLAVNYTENGSKIHPRGVYRVSPKTARIRCTQNRFSGNTFLMCRVFVHIYLWAFLDSGGFTLLS